MYDMAPLPPPRKNEKKKKQKNRFTATISSNFASQILAQIHLNCELSIDLLVFCWEIADHTYVLVDEWLISILIP